MESKVAILISGAPRSFQKNLWPFLRNLPQNYHFFFSFSITTDSKYTNKQFNPQLLLDDPRTKILIQESTLPDCIDLLTQRERNIVYQWYRLNNLINHVSSSYSTVIRIRPDVKFEISVNDFVKLNETNQKEYTIYIPKGFDIYDATAVDESTLRTCINDQIAFGTYDAMKHYCELYKHLSYVQPLLSEQQLFSHLAHLSVIRIDLPYNLVLSDCFVLSLCGDSGAGKTTISHLINSVVPYDKSLVFETDRYHRWERGDSNYLVYTHLNPHANNLSTLNSDVYKLVLGDTIYTVDYDHSNGKFTYNNAIKSNDYLIICGLHTLYEKSLRDISDIKIYVDTELSLKTHWKVERDIKYRGASSSAVKKSIERRYDDYKEYIEPQRDYADILIKYYPIADDDLTRIGLCLKCKKELGFLLLEKMEKIYNELEITSDYVYLVFENQDLYTVISNAITAMKLPILVDLKSGYDGIIQYIFLILLWNY